MNKLSLSVLAVSLVAIPSFAMAQTNRLADKALARKVIEASVSAATAIEKVVVNELNTKIWAEVEKEAKGAEKVTDKTKRLEKNEVKFHKEVAKYAKGHINAINKLNENKEVDKTAALEEYAKNMDNLYRNELNAVKQAARNVEETKDPTSVSYELYVNLLEEDARNDMQLWDRAQASENPGEEYCKLRRAYEQDPNNSLIRLIAAYRAQFEPESQQEKYEDVEK